MTFNNLKLIFNIIQMEDNIPAWIKHLDEADYKFIERFIVSSGSLKELAKEYKVTYPTIRVRLDRLIEKIKLTLAKKGEDSFKLKIQQYVIEGQIDHYVAKNLLNEHKKALRKGK